MEQLTVALLHLKQCDGKGPVEVAPGVSACQECARAAALIGACLARATLVVEAAGKSIAASEKKV